MKRCCVSNCHTNCGCWGFDVKILAESLLLSILVIDRRYFNSVFVDIFSDTK